jgi:heme/copper-type cytochrome/quinol oxidase subunit 2
LLLAKNPIVNLTALNDYLFFYIFGIKNFTKNSDAIELYKNPYRPLRKGVSSMLRLHSTGAVAMPIEVRLQVLASSRDVIHSWSVPSAGVKIDCVPGYTSHKIMIFLIEGIY